VKKSQDNEDKCIKKKYNLLFIMVDELRYPVDYENDEIKNWRNENLHALNFLKSHGLEFKRHYTGSTACSPARATLFTGHYPSLHGVSQTAGAAKTNQEVFWLDENGVPAMGEYFKVGGYDNYYIGKWHVSEEDILVPGSFRALSSYSIPSGEPNKNQELYVNSNKLNDYGFEGWFGPEPHGSSGFNSGNSAPSGLGGRDVVYSDEVVNLLKKLDSKKSRGDDNPWLVVASFVNPHDIALYGELTKNLPAYNFKINKDIPVYDIPTKNENLFTKPSAQRNYRTSYPKIFQPTSVTDEFIQFYYSLQEQVDAQIMKVLETLKESSMYEDTIVIFTSDHGELLGSHGGLLQKWHNAYEESIHLPLIFHNPKLFPEYKSDDHLTSHIDIIPTMLSLANIDIDSLYSKLNETNRFTTQLVGKKICIEGTSTNCDCDYSRMDEGIYFTTSDEISKGSQQQNAFTGQPYDSIPQPNNVDAIVARLENGNIYKFVRYSDPQGSVPSEFEIYDLTNDPYEQDNLAFPFVSPQNLDLKTKLETIINRDILKKKLQNLNVLSFDTSRLLSPSP